MTSLSVTCSSCEDSHELRGRADATLLATITSPTQLELSEKGNELVRRLDHLLTPLTQHFLVLPFGLTSPIDLLTHLLHPHRACE